MTRAYVGLGSNLENPLEQVERAFTELGELPETRLAARSSLYRSAPVGYADQPAFVNAVAALDTDLPARALLEGLQGIEAAHARRRSFANAPRTLDVDLLLFGDEISSDPILTLPHPRMHERAFVLLPLVEVAPELRIPGHGAAADCLEACAGQAVERIA